MGGTADYGGSAGSSGGTGTDLHQVLFPTTSQQWPLVIMEQGLLQTFNQVLPFLFLIAPHLFPFFVHLLPNSGFKVINIPLLLQYGGSAVIIIIHNIDLHWFLISDPKQIFWQSGLNRHVGYKLIQNCDYKFQAAVLRNQVSDCLELLWMPCWVGCVFAFVSELKITDMVGYFGWEVNINQIKLFMQHFLDPGPIIALTCHSFAIHSVSQ